ncbi:MAG: GMC family oxidoreductase, partial [Enterobacteriaceae bacterium]
MANNTFDYIITGAGSAGCVIATLLVQRLGARVLLLEAGGSDQSPFIRMPAGVGKLIGHKTWNYETQEEPHADNRRIAIPQGRVLGGGSSVNGMIYIRGQAQDYDEWQQQWGCTGWGYQDVLPYFKRSERNESLADSYHGNQGNLPVSESRYR